MKLPVCPASLRIPARTAALLLLLLLPSYCGELLSGSSPPKEYVNTLPLNIILYGGGTLLVRELTVRWHLQWSQLFLALAFAVLEEGLCCKSFFDPNWKNLRSLSNYANLFGVQWGWTLMLLTYHMTIRTLIPIRMVDMLFPYLKNSPLLGRKGIISIAIAFTSVIIFGYTCFPEPHNPYRLSVGKTIFSLLAVAFFSWCAWRARNSGNPILGLDKSKIFSRIPVLAIASLLLMTVTTFTPYLMSSFRFVPMPADIIVQIVILLMVSLFCLATIVQDQIVNNRDGQFILGCLSSLIITSFLQANFMPVIGAVTICLCLLWYYFVLRAQTGTEASSAQIGNTT